MNAAKDQVHWLRIYDTVISASRCIFKIYFKIENQYCLGMVPGFDVIGSYLINSLKVCKFQLDDRLEPPL